MDVLRGDAGPVGEEAPPRAAALPLVTDLDGTLLAADTLWEGTIAAIRCNPACTLALLAGLSRGRAAFKSEVAKRSALDVAGLPWRADVLEYLRSERLAGRRIILATAAHQTVAEQVSGHLDLFDEILSSTDVLNLKGTAKRDALVRRFGFKGFDYIGDSASDRPVWQSCRIAHVAGSTRGPAISGTETGKRFGTPAAGFWRLTRAFRVHQWVKNLLVCVPTLLNHALSWEILRSLLVTFAGFSLVASGTYLINDLFDLESDRRHSQKSRRAIASGELSIPGGLALAASLITAGLAASLLVGTQLLLCLLAYLALTVFYSAWVRNKPILDVVALALLYTLRVYTGGLVTRAYISPWLFQFSIFLFLSLAFVKRYSELVGLRQRRKLRIPGRNYNVRDMGLVGQAGLGSGLLAALVLALYVNGREIEKLYPHPEMLWGVCPLFVYWIVRVWLIAHRGNMREDPILFAFRDRVSYVVGLLITGAVLLGLMPNAH